MRKSKKMLKKLKQSKLETKASLYEKRQRCEVYARVVGYLRPVNQWNEGKMAEYNDRKMFKPQPEQINEPDKEYFTQDEYKEYIEQEHPNYAE